MPDQADADLIFARRNAAPALSATSDMPSIVEETEVEAEQPAVRPRARPPERSPELPPARTHLSEGQSELDAQLAAREAEFMSAQRRLADLGSPPEKPYSGNFDSPTEFDAALIAYEVDRAERGRVERGGTVNLSHRVS